MADIWDKAKEVLGVVAPTLGVALGGPLGGVAGKMLSQVLLGKDDADAAATAMAVANATPDQLLALKKADLDFQAKMKELDIEVVKLDASDRNSARQREVAVKDSTPKVIATIVLASWVTIQFFLLTHEIIDSMREIIMRTLGTLDMILGMVMTYYYGSSSGSKEKNETIKNIVSK